MAPTGSQTPPLLVMLAGDDRGFDAELELVMPGRIRTRFLKWSMYNVWVGSYGVIADPLAGDPSLNEFSLDYGAIEMEFTTINTDGSAGATTRSGLISPGGGPGDTQPPTVTSITNTRFGQSVSSVEPGANGIRTIEVRFSEAVNFSAGGVIVQRVSFPGGAEVIGATVAPLSVAGSGSGIMAVTFAAGSITDTWLKVTLRGNGLIADLAGNFLDGDGPPSGSECGYLREPSMDLPSGNGIAGGDAVFYVGSLRADLTGDRLVGDGDLSVLLTNWNTFAGAAQGNLNEAGIVDDADLSILLANWSDRLDALPSCGGGVAGGVAGGGVAGGAEDLQAVTREDRQSQPGLAALVPNAEVQLAPDVPGDPPVVAAGLAAIIVTGRAPAWIGLPALATSTARMVNRPAAAGDPGRLDAEMVTLLDLPLPR